jgi:hypothetical protein
MKTTFIIFISLLISTQIAAQVPSSKLAVFYDVISPKNTKYLTVQKTIQSI